MAIPLEPDREQRSELVDRARDHLQDWFDAAEAMDAVGRPLDDATLARFRRPPGEAGRSIESILQELGEAGVDGIYHPSGGHMSYIPNAGLFTSALAEWLAAGLNRYTGVAGAAPGFSAIEHGMVDWMRSLFDLGTESSGILLSGGSMANFTAVVTARHTMLGDHFGDGVLYLTPHTHHSVSKSARLAGLRAEQMVSISVDDELRMSTEMLAERVEADRAAGRRPFLVVASAGTTDTGTIDPLDELAGLCAEKGLWLHVDAAYGGFFQLTGRGRAALAGIGRAHSITLDPHKGLSLPFGLGALLVSEESHLVDAHLGRGAYLRDEDSYHGVRDIASLGPELSRPFRGLQMWLPLQLHGVAPFREALDNSLDLAGHAYQRLQTVRGIERVWSPDLSIVAFRFSNDAQGRAALDAVNADRRTHLSPTTIDGRFVLRLAILNRRTTRDHVDHAIDIIEKTLIG